MIPDKKVIVRASYNAAVYDSILEVPDQHTLRFITGADLHRFLPKWVSMETGIVDQEKLDQKALEIVASSYLTPVEFSTRYALEPRAPRSNSFHDLNYMLVKEIISISPGGKVNPLVYKLSTARVNKEVGMDSVRKMYDQALETNTDPQRRKYYTFIHE